MKQRILLFLTILGLVCNVYGQQHVVYNGITMVGKLDHFGDQLVKQGYLVKESQPGEVIYKGVSMVLKDSVEVSVFATPISNMVSAVYERFTCDDTKRIDNLYKKAVKLLTKQYGHPEVQANELEYTLKNSSKSYGYVYVKKSSDGICVSFYDLEGTRLSTAEGRSELYGLGSEKMFENMLFHGIAMGIPAINFRDSLQKHGFTALPKHLNEYKKIDFANYSPRKITISENPKGKVSKVQVCYSADNELGAKEMFGNLKEWLDTLVRDCDSYNADNFRIYNVNNLLGDNVGSIVLYQQKDSVSLVYRDTHSCYDTDDEELANKDKRKHLTFMGIPINGNVVPFFSRLIEDKGFRVLDKKDNNLWFFREEWGGERNVQLVLAPYTKKQLLYAVSVLINCPDNDSGWKLDRFAELFTHKLGYPDVDDKGGNSYNVYSWGRKVGRIYLQTINQRQLNITYYDDINTRNMLNEENKDLF